MRCKGQIMTRRLCQIKANVTLALVVLALAMRVIVPAGWMPSVTSGSATFTLCTGTGMVEAWVDQGGKIHKSLPGKGGVNGEPCAFASAGGGYIANDLRAALPVPFLTAVLLIIEGACTSVGQGLAAPPPPSTGPPQLI
jgi:hypothetical protein